jgi:hypothetical protein
MEDKNLWFLCLLRMVGATSCTMRSTIFIRILLQFKTAKEIAALFFATQYKKGNFLFKKYITS